MYASMWYLCLKFIYVIIMFKIHLCYNYIKFHFIKIVIYVLKFIKSR